MNSACLCSLAGQYENPIPTRCLAPIDFFKIPALTVFADELSKLSKGDINVRASLKLFIRRIFTRNFATVFFLRAIFDDKRQLLQTFLQLFSHDIVITILHV